MRLIFLILHFGRTPTPLKPPTHLKSPNLLYWISEMPPGTSDALPGSQKESFEEKGLRALAEFYSRLTPNLELVSSDSNTSEIPMESLFPEIDFHSIRGSRGLEHIELMGYIVRISDSLFSLFSSPLADQTDAEHKQRVADIALGYGAAAPRLVCTPGAQFSRKEHKATRVPCDAKLYYYTNDPILKRVADEALPDHCVCEGGEGNSHHRGCRVLGYYHCACSRWWLSATTWYKSDTRRISNPKICRGCEEKVFPWQFTPTLNALELGSDSSIAGSVNQIVIIG